jgi:hypothetical protein
VWNANRAVTRATSFLVLTLHARARGLILTLIPPPPPLLPSAHTAAMPKLYYTPTSCGAASFITAHTAQLDDVEVETVDLATHKTASGKARRARVHARRGRGRSAPAPRACEASARTRVRRSMTMHGNKTTTSMQRRRP